MASTHDPKSSGSSARSCVLRMEMVCREAKLRPRREVHSGGFERKSPRLNRLSRCARHRPGTTPDRGRNARCQSPFSAPVVQGLVQHKRLSLIRTMAPVKINFERQSIEKATAVAGHSQGGNTQLKRNRPAREVEPGEITEPHTQLIR